MIRAARQLTALLTVVLCALWSLLLLQTPDAQAAPAPAPVSVTAYPETAHDGETSGAAHDGETVRASHHAETAGAADHTPHVGAKRVTTPPDPHLAADTVAELPAAVEHSVRFPVPPAAPAAAVPDLSVPARGVLAGGPRRERAPPGDRHAPRDSRGPPAPRHS
ncbi:hypothetical protein [Streptomyces gardneri]|uniref:Secreted protein n=1 Tax=Streptomyces gardneri TaxID=66892 RepID=A0A4Y3RA88_9ACTN|nr:hypothetical protein [Streptomyces gardneri]GEB54675.1 hypothetical protein SGA01_02800 [Streptomyces gardneri]GHG89190.1 hypothetical protein GCM10017674_15860 [Streptomyces gardneri]